MNKCPRCENENLKEDYNYCPVCGLDLRTAPEVPVQEQLNVDKANKILENQMISLSKSTENILECTKAMIEIYSILFPYHP